MRVFFLFACIIATATVASNEGDFFPHVPTGGEDDPVTLLQMNSFAGDDGIVDQEVARDKADEAAMEAAIKSAKAENLNAAAVADDKVLKPLEQDELRGKKTAQTIAKEAQAVANYKWDRKFTSSFSPHEVIVADLKASEVVAQKLMKMKADATSEMSDATDGVRVLHDAEQKIHELGETMSPLEEGRLKAAQWRQGKKLAVEEEQLEKAEKGHKTNPKLKSLVKGAEALAKRSVAAEKSAHEKAEEMAKQIDDAGFALNKWYNANEHELKGHAKGKSNVYKVEARLGENSKPMNNVQRNIEKKAMDAINQVAANAAKAIKAAATTAPQNAPSSGANAAKAIKAAATTAPQNAPSGESSEKTHVQLKAFNEMRAHVSQDVASVKREANELVEAQSNLANEDKAYETDLNTHHD